MSLGGIRPVSGPQGPTGIPGIGLTLATTGVTGGDVVSYGATGGFHTRRDHGINLRDVAGDDLGARINAAVGRLGADPGLIVCDDPSLAHTTVATLGAGHFLQFGPGLFLQSAPGSALVLGGSNCGIRGAGESTILRNSTTNRSCIAAASSADSIYVGDLRLERAAVGAVGAYALNFATTVDHALVENVRITGVAAGQGHYYGAWLAQTGYSRMVNCDIDSCRSHGVLLQHTAAGALQWYLSEILSGGNTEDGFRYVAQQFDGQTASSVGEMRHCLTYANGGRGLSVFGSASIAVESLRVDDCFFGEDGAEEIRLDCYGGDHRISNTFCELSGTGSDNVWASANNGRIVLDNVHSTGASRNGISLGGTHATLNNVVSNNNGRDAAAGDRSGLRVRAGIVSVTGGFYGNKSGANQTHGITYDVDTVQIVGADLQGNATAPTSGTPTNGTTLIVGCMPATVDTLIPGTVKAAGSAAFSPTVGIGYATGAGGTVTQATSKTTAVTLNKVSGQITLNNAALASGASATFTLNNSTIAATDTVSVSVQGGGTADAYAAFVVAVAAGSCHIRVSNLTGGSLSEAPVVNFNVFKGVAS